MLCAVVASFLSRFVDTPELSPQSSPTSRKRKRPPAFFQKQTGIANKELKANNQYQGSRKK
jgi:hypothetical protein